MEELHLGHLKSQDGKLGCFLRFLVSTIKEFKNRIKRKVEDNFIKFKSKTWGQVISLSSCPEEQDEEAERIPCQFWVATEGWEVGEKNQKMGERAQTVQEGMARLCQVSTKREEELKRRVALGKNSWKAAGLTRIQDWGCTSQSRELWEGKPCYVMKRMLIYSTSVARLIEISIPKGWSLSQMIDQLRVNFGRRCVSSLRSRYPRCQSFDQKETSFP